MKRIIVHHSATKDGKTLSWAAIRRYHIHNNQWLDIGYHAGIELVDDEYECLFGRPTTMQGAHTSSHNWDSLGFCFVGNYDLVAPTPEMLSVAVRRVLAPWLEQYGLQASDIYAHRDYADKSCPGALFDMGDLRSMVEAALEK